MVEIRTLADQMRHEYGHGTPESPAAGLGGVQSDLLNTTCVDVAWLATGKELTDWGRFADRSVRQPTVVSISTIVGAVGFFQQNVCQFQPGWFP